MKYFKLIITLVIFFVVSGCTCYGASEHNAEMVSTENRGYLNYSNEYEDILMANVIIYNNNYSSFLGLKYKKHNTYGSGFIYNSDDSYYYVLTNNHVVSYDYNCNKHELLIEDYYGNKYNAELISKDINYDLALIRFEKKILLKELSISKDNIKVRDSVRTMGNPDSNRNVISDGMISCFSNINLDTMKSKVNFEVIVHSASIKGGSSGSALLNKYNEVIGVTFAGVFDKEGTFITGYAIPASRINEFLSKYI